MKTVKFVMPVVAFFFAVAMAFASVMPVIQDGFAHQDYLPTQTERIPVVNLSGGQSCTTASNANPVCLVSVNGAQVEAYDQFVSGAAIDLLYRTPN
jgi:Family of unknown function (DUF6520)